MGRRTVGGLLFTKGGSILLFREDSSRHKSNNCCSRHGCSSRHSVNKGKGKELHKAAVPTEPTPATPRRSRIFKNPNRKPPQAHESTASDSMSKGATSSGSETGNSSRDTPGRDLLARLKERVNASRKRSLARENSTSSSSSNGLGASSSPSSRSISRPSHRAASRIRKADEGRPSAGSDRVRRNGNRDARRNSERSNDDLLLVEQITRDHEPAGEGFLAGFMARYRSGLQGALSSLEDSMEDSNGYWRFDMGGTEELENYFIFNDRHRGMRMDIDGMSYEEEYLAGEEVGKMSCKHYYHISCIQHWLRQKNWCPICKSVALNTNTN
ncbi:hypothetical protein PR202_ga19141 [Eleusine coracana subsp. coracana]|uniref:RING-type E3 ubiquitin transferase n=1 Tax=Eleusine coracana subsp. coracana TaxID=191504 RepID=A0AAV5CVM5_ELECO|nr:hypothetical protein PR202_ga19141 [Eleusine coracana subsp. coracana]